MPSLKGMAAPEVSSQASAPSWPAKLTVSGQAAFRFTHARLDWVPWRASLVRHPPEVNIEPSPLKGADAANEPLTDLSPSSIIIQYNFLPHLQFIEQDEREPVNGKL